MSGDEDEVEDLLKKGADINTATVDGLTALHQVRNKYSIFVGLNNLFNFMVFLKVLQLRRRLQKW